MRIAPARRLKGSINLPGDKSISHRAAMIAAMATGESHLTNFSSSSDCSSTLGCLEQLGIQIERNGYEVRIGGAGPRGFSAPKEPLDCGNSGSTIRMLAGLLAGQDFSATVTGDESLRGRPMRRIIEPLEMMGAAFQSRDGYPPLRITGRQPLRSISYELPVASAQLKTCLLFAGLLANGRTEVIEKRGGTRDHTERMLRWFGVDTETGASPSDGELLSKHFVEGPARFAGRNVAIPGDFSSAAFLIAAAAFLPESELEIQDVGLNPTRTKLLELLRALGASIETTGTSEICNELSGTLHLRGPAGRATADSSLNRESRIPLSPVTVEGEMAAALIDELPLVAVIGTQLPVELIIRDAKELRFKETDRIAATVANLRAMGAEVEEQADGLTVNGTAKLHGAKLESFGDHRIAMAFTIAALLAEGESDLSGSECVAISFPEFFECLESVTERS